MEMSKIVSAEEPDVVGDSEVYEPPVLVKHGSLRELTLSPVTASGPN
jgi:hypothetical protein